jgi:dGTPase
VVTVKTNRFYSPFDFELLHPEEGRHRHSRTAFQQDRDRIIYTSSFRRLQAKTQVFFAGEYDFYRTRLTHSIEVAQIGRSIAHFLKTESPLLDDDFFIDPDLVEAACLAHDIGHPPFGHAGEKTINRLMEAYGGFEGNAQTLRMITETIYSSPRGREGMNPTRAFVDGVMKYKKLYRDMFVDGRQPPNHFLYDEQDPYVRFVLGDVPEAMRHADDLNRFRSIECQIMDWADDTAYSLNDLIDGIGSGLMTSAKIEKWAADRHLAGHGADQINVVLKAISEKSLVRVFSRKIGEFIRACRLEELTNFMSATTSRYAYRLEIDPDIRKAARLYADLSREIVFCSPQIYQLEYKADFMLARLFDAFIEHYVRNGESRMVLLPTDTETYVRTEPDPLRRARRVCDYITGMTDGFAIRTYKRLFDPDFGSIVDLV